MDLCAEELAELLLQLIEGAEVGKAFRCRLPEIDEDVNIALLISRSSCKRSEDARVNGSPSFQYSADCFPPMSDLVERDRHATIVGPRSIFDQSPTSTWSASTTPVVSAPMDKEVELTRFRVVMDVLGHSQIRLMVNTNGHVIPEMRKEAAERMEEILRD